MTTDIDRHCNDLTQLCSREQLSALMDGALPEDQTRFLLRRLQHDGELAACWERWRTAADVMRGVAPSHRLPADFADGVTAALRAGAPPAAVTRVAARATARRRWGGGMALAATLAAAGFMLWPTADQGSAVAAPEVAVTDSVQPPKPADPERVPPAQAPVAPGTAGGMPMEIAAVAALAARAERGRGAQRERRTHLAPAPLPQSDMLARVTPAASSAADIQEHPWPRSVLPQYGDSALTVGFGDLRASGDAPLVIAPRVPPAMVKVPAPVEMDKAAADVPPATKNANASEAVPSPTQP